MADSTLQKFEEKMLKQVSPLEVKSVELLDKATVQKVEDDTTLAAAIALKKEINAHSKFVKDSRLALTRPLDEMKSTILTKESEILLPIEKAKANLADKILTYEEETERLRLAEEERIDRILDSISVAVWMYETPAQVDARGKAIKLAFSELTEEDQNNADVKLAFRQSVDALTTRKSNLEEEARQKAERERLAEEAKAQSAERAKLEKQRAAIEDQERALKAEQERQQREIERQKLEAEALEKKKAEDAAEKARPKSNIATITEFEVVDEFIVERKYCSPDLRKIRDAIKEGATDIEGVRIFQTKKMR